MISREEILRRLNQGEDPQEILASTDTNLESPRHLRAALLRRCSLVRSFDQSLLDGPLTDGLRFKPPDREDFLKSPDLVASSTVPGQYSVKESARTPCLNWWTLPENRSGLKSVCDSLIRHFDSERAAPDRLGLLALVQPEVASTELMDRYREADRAVDLAGCETLINLLGWYGPLLPETMRMLRLEREGYFNSRIIHADDWTRSSRYIARNAITDQFKAFNSDPLKWIFQIHGSGGKGKTAYLRWLISRYCVPEPGDGSPRTLVAQADMDFIRLLQLDQAPWLILMVVARELDTQMPYRPFASLFQSWLSYAPLLDSPAAAAPPPQPAGLIPDFVSAMTGYPNLLIVLDTLEELVLRHQQSLLQVLDVLASLRAHLPGMKLILSGRYNVLERDDLEGAARFASETTTVEIRAFSPAESVEYLRKLRRLEGDQYDVAAIGEKCSHLPFKLALCADLAIANGRMTRADLAAMGDVEEAYLIERIIERIPDEEMPLRWLLRYAVIPRPGRLDFEFADGVLRQHLEKEMQQKGLTLLDKPDQSVWKKVDGVYTLEDVWKDLLKYRSESGWIVIKEGRPRLQPEIVVPMRALLQKEDIFGPLHADAARYFEARGDLAEAAYHWFWAEGPQAASRWRDAIRTAPTLEKSLDVASAICGGDLLNDDFAALSHRVYGTVVTPPLVIEALFERASLQVRSDLLRRTEVPFKQAQADLAQAERLEKRWGRPVIDAVRKVLVRAAISDLQGKSSEALALLDAALSAKTPPEPRDAIAMHVLCARLHPDVARADESLESAIRLSAGDPHPAFRISWLRQTQGKLWFDFVNLGRAGSCYELALTALQKEKAAARDILRCLETLITIDRSQMRYSRTPLRLAVAEQLDQSDEAVRIFVKHYGARLLVDQGRIHEANVLADYGNSGTDSAAIARQRLLWGEIAGAERQFDASVRAYDEAAKGFVEAASERQIAEAVLQKARMLLEDKGDLNISLDHRFPGASALWLSLYAEIQVLRLAKQSNVAEARGVWLEARKLPGTERQPAVRQAEAARLQARWMAVGLALNLAPGSPAPASQAWTEALAQVEPWEARLPLLDPFRHWKKGPGQELPVAVTQAFMKLFPRPVSSDPDFRYQALALAPVLAFLGGEDAAASLIKDALDMSEPGEVLLRRRLLLAAQQFGFALPDRYLYSPLERARDNSPLKTSLQIEIAEILWKNRQHKAARALLEGIEIKPLADSQYEFLYLRLVAAVAESEDPSGEGVVFARHASAIAGRLGWDKLEPLEIERRSSAKSEDDALQVLPVADLLEIRPNANSPNSLAVHWQGFDRKPVRANSSRLPFPNLFSTASRTACQDDWKSLQDAAESLKNFLPDEYSHAGPNRPRVDSVFCTAGGSLASLPWESAMDLSQFRYVYRTTTPQRNEAITVAWMQQWLNRMGFPCEIDGFMRPQMAALLREAARKHRVLADGWNGVETKRRMASLLSRDRYVVTTGVSGRYGRHDLDFERFYQRHRFTPISLDPNWVKRGFPQHETAFLHIPLDFADGRVAVELNFADSSAGSSSLEESKLGSILTAETLAARYLGGDFRPFVLLDPPHPGRQREYERQLLLRNQFAYDLMNTGSVRGVLAAGFAEPSRESINEALNRLLAAIADLRCLGELGQMAGSFAALFCSDPTLPAV